ncbi:MAG: serine/threonine-protein kinase [Candidatus Nanopelagicales bacterium]
MAHSDLHDDDPMRIGDALIVGRLGAGGMGVVYLGRTSQGRAVAVKVVRKDLAADADFRRRFADEVRVMRDVGAEHTAGVLATGVDAEQPWVVMDYVQGPTLADRVRLGALPADELDAFAVDLVGAVAAVHAAGVVHRDLKPSNVVLTPDGVRLLDFGVARAPFAEADEAARVGSLTWMAPEQIGGDPCGPAADVHAVGMLLYFAACGRHVYGYGQADAVAWRIQNSAPQVVDLQGGAVKYRDAITACLSKKPSDRPALGVIAGIAGADGPVALPPPAVPALPPVPPADPVAPPSVPPAGPTGVPPEVPPPAGDKPEAAASGTGRRLVRRVAVLGIVLVLLWVIGWIAGTWPLGGPLAPAAEACPATGDPADLATGSNTADRGGGVVEQSLLGMFPGPFGEFNVPSESVACQIGAGVTVTCSESSLPDGSLRACTASDRTANQVTVGIGRAGDNWSWAVV